MVRGRGAEVLERLMRGEGAGMVESKGEGEEGW